MTEIPTGSRPGFTPPPVLTRRSSPPHGRWMAAFLPPFAAGRTLTPHRSRAAVEADEEWGRAQFEFAPVEFDRAESGEGLIEDVVVDDVEAADVDDVVLEVPATEPWEPDVWPTAEWTAEDTPQPASEAAAFEAWVSTGAAGDADRTAAPDAPDEVARLVAQRLDELAGQVRSRGLAALGNPQDPDALSRLIAAVVAGYIGRSD